MDSDKTLQKQSKDSATGHYGTSKSVSVPTISLEEVVRFLPKGKREEWLNAYEKADLKKVFGDGELMKTAVAFVASDLNESRAAATLYMHRNTLIYRLNKIKKLTGLDIRRYDMAITFQILAVLYEGERRHS
jgi:carbohydrate diacid regulator